MTHGEEWLAGVLAMAFAAACSPPGQPATPAQAPCPSGAIAPGSATPPSRPPPYLRPRAIECAAVGAPVHLVVQRTEDGVTYRGHAAHHYETAADVRCTPAGDEALSCEGTWREANHAARATITLLPNGTVRAVLSTPYSADAVLSCIAVERDRLP